MSKIQLLLMDNHHDFLDTLAEFLERENYNVLRAYTLEQARNQLAEARVHVAILDIRMVDDTNKRDRSGVDLAKEPNFREILKIMLTVSDSIEDVLDVLEPIQGVQPAVRYVAKEKDKELLLKAVREVVAEYLPINWDLVIEWEAILSFAQLVTIIDPTVNEAYFMARAAELEDLFRKLFSRHSQITIGPVLTYHTGHVILPVFAYNNKGEDRNNEEQFIVSLGQRALILTEDDRYEREVLQCIRTDSVRREKRTKTAHFAATAYTLVGGKPEDVRTLHVYCLHSAEGTLEVLSNLYRENLKAWSERGRFSDREIDRYTFYVDWLAMDQQRLSAAELRQRVESICRQALATGLMSLEYASDQLIFHLESSLEILSLKALYRDVPKLVNKGVAQWGATHGRVNGNTVLADPDGKTWLIDFTQAGHAPLLCEFVLLETAMVLDIFAESDLPARYQLEKQLRNVTKLDDTLSRENLSPRATDLIAQVEHIRHLAAALAGCDWAAYRGGLLFCALARIATYNPHRFYTRRELTPYVHALLRVAILCPQMADLVPPDIPNPIPAIWIDEARKEVWIEGQRKRVTPDRFPVLLYLYHHKNQVCEFQDIIEKALKETYNKHNRHSEHARIHNIIQRLREDIEPDPDNPKYVKNERGLGYKLELR
jgi:DNA-binding response OmpR family regulator